MPSHHRAVLDDPTEKHGYDLNCDPSHVEHAAALASRLQAEAALVHERAHKCSAESCRAQQLAIPRRQAPGSRARRTCDAEHQPHVRCQRGRRVQAAHDSHVQWLCHWLCRVDFCTPQARRSESSSALPLHRREGTGLQAAAAVGSSALAHARARSGCGFRCRCWWGEPSPGADMPGPCRRWRMHEHALAAGSGADAGGVSPVLVQICQGRAGVGACTSTHWLRVPVQMLVG